MESFLFFLYCLYLAFWRIDQDACLSLLYIITIHVLIFFVTFSCILFIFSLISKNAFFSPIFLKVLTAMFIHSYIPSSLLLYFRNDLFLLHLILQCVASRHFHIVLIPIHVVLLSISTILLSFLIS